MRDDDDRFPVIGRVTYPGWSQQWFDSTAGDVNIQEEIASLIPDEFKGYAEFRHVALEHPTWLPTLITEMKAINSVHGKRSRHEKRVVYFLQRGNDGPIKVGVSLNLARRIRELQSTSSEPLRLLGTALGGYDLESALHDELRDHRLHGEWFVPTFEVLAVVRRESNRTT